MSSVEGTGSAGTAFPAGGPLRPIRLALLSLRLGLLHALQYRTDFWIAALQSMVGLATSLAGLAVVFSQTDDLGGWQSDELVALVGVFMIVAGLLGLVVRPSLERLMEGIRLGTLDFDLTKPVDAQLMVSVRQVEIWRLIDVILGSGILVYAIGRLGERVGPVQALSFAVLLVAGVAIIYSFLLVLATFSFWLVRLENIMVIFGSMYEAGRWPIGIYPPWLRVALTVAVPVAFAITIPVESLLGRLEPATVVVAIVIAAAFLGGSRWFWRFGLRHYTGASA
ncbi:MAG: ABC transporter permease [Chloroflexota bacterium]